MFLTGLTLQATILAYMFVLVETNKVTVSLGPIGQYTSSSQNVAFIQQFLLNLLKAAFPHLNE